MLEKHYANDRTGIGTVIPLGTMEGEIQQKVALPATASPQALFYEHRIQVAFGSQL